MADDMDLDEELLMVAGRGGAGGSKAAPASRKRPRKAARSDSEEEEEEEESEGESEEEGALASDDEEEEEEEEEEEDVPQQRGKKVAITGRRAPRKRSTATTARAVEDEGYNSDLYEGEEDRNRLAALTEFERELILTERAEKRDREREKRQLLKQQEKAASSTRSRVEVRSSSRRPKEETDRDRAIRDLAAARERKEAADAQRAEAQQRKSSSKKPRAASAWDDDDDEDEEEEPRRGGKGRDEEEEEAVSSEAGSLEPEDALAELGPGRRGRDDDDYDDDYDRRDRDGRYDDDRREDAYDDEAGLEEIRTIQVKRHRLERWDREPFLSKVLPGGVVRMGFGERPNPDRHGHVERFYLMMQIVGLKEGTPYKFAPESVKPGAPLTMTSQYLVVQDGGHSKTMQMSLVSNQSVTEEEFSRWQRHQGKAQEPQILRGDVARVKEQLQQAEHYKYTASDIKDRIKEKRAKGLLPVNFAAEKSRLLLMLSNATAEKDEPQVEELTQLLADLEERMAIQAAQADKAGMGDINRRNREANLQTSLQNVGNRPEGEKERGGADPFSRRQTRSNVYWNTKMSQKAGGPEDKAEAGGTTPELAVPPPVPTEAEKLASSLAHLDPAELVKKLDLELDLSVLPEQTAPSGPPPHRQLLGRRWRDSLSALSRAEPGARNVLSLEGWKQRVAGQPT